MQVDVKTVIYLIIGLITIGGAVVGFFTMQTRQNMKIDQLEKEVNDVKDKQSKAAHYQIETEKNIVEINTKLDNIMDALNDIKVNGCQVGRKNV